MWRAELGKHNGPVENYFILQFCFLYLKKKGRKKKKQNNTKIVISSHYQAFKTFMKIKYLLQNSMGRERQRPADMGRFCYLFVKLKMSDKK